MNLVSSSTDGAFPDRPRAPDAPGFPERLRSTFYDSPVYRWTLLTRPPGGLAAVPPDPWPGHAETGAAILRGNVGFSREARPVAEFWRPVAHSFSWLRDLRAVGRDEAQARARALVREWIADHGAPAGDAWRPDVLGERIGNWLAQHDFLCTGADQRFRAAYYRSLCRQARHLSRVADGGPGDARRLIAVKGLIYAGVCLPGRGRWREQGIELLERELARQVLPDGGHFERSPSQHLAVLRDLIDVRAALLAAEQEVPTRLQEAIDRMAPMLRNFRHGDGGLAIFNDSIEEPQLLIEMVLRLAESAGEAPASAPHTGFQRLAAGSTVVILDAGAPPPPGADALAHAGTLAFEMSVGRQRLIVNCGGYRNGEGQGDVAAWRQSCRASAAHSTLVVDDTNSSQVLKRGGLGIRPAEVSCRREHHEGDTLIDASHDGYGPRFHLVHRRRLYLPRGGDDLRGEDSLLPLGGAGRCGGDRFAIRFHLHPDVRASKVWNRKWATLVLPSGARWRFQAAGATLAIEESVYLGTGEAIQRSRQLVVSGRLGGEPAQVKWAIRRQL